MELYEQIRKARQREEGVSIRELARRFHVHRRDVRYALASALPPPRTVAARPAPVLGPWKSVIDDWLEADRSAPRKQRHTARRVWQRLVEERGVDVGESTVRRYVAEVRRRQELPLAEMAVPQHHPLGEEAEVDFGTVSVYMGGLLTEVSLFLMRLSASGRTYTHAYLNEAQEVFLDGHVRAFAHLGGYAGDLVKDRTVRGHDAWSSSRASRPSKIFWRPSWPFAAASSRCRWSVGRNSTVVTKNEHDSQIDSKWQSISTGRAQ